MDKWLSHDPETGDALWTPAAWCSVLRVATAVVGAGVASAGASIYGSQNAASAQEQAANTASQTQMNEFNQLQGNLAPYVATGNNANAQLTNQLTSLTAPITMNEATLQQTPGYQFNLQQGLRGVQNSSAQRGLGVSGAEMKGAASYATGLADSTYQNQFNNAQTNRQTAYNMLSGQQSLGENAAAGVGNAGIATGNQLASNTIGAGNAAAAASNSLTSASNTASNSLTNGLLFNQLTNSGSGSGLFGNGDVSQATAGQAGLASGLTLFPDGSIG